MRNYIHTGVYILYFGCEACLDLRPSSFLFHLLSVVQVRIDQPEYSTDEDQSPVTVCVTLIEANIERNLVVTLSTSDNTAQGEVYNNYVTQYMDHTC